MTSESTPVEIAKLLWDGGFDFLNKEPRYPREVEVYWDPRDPSKTAIANEIGTAKGGKQRSGCAITIFLTLFTLWFVFNVVFGGE